MVSNIRQTFVPFIFSIVIMILFLQPMWNTAIEDSKDLTSQMEVYEIGTKWISENLEKNESAIFPLGQMFWTLDPSLKSHTKTYSEFWHEEKVDRVHSSEDEKNKVRSLFWEHVLNNDNNVKFIVVTWNDKFMKSILEVHSRDLLKPNFCENVSNALTEVKRVELEIPSTGWKNYMIVCQVRCV